MLYQRTKQIVQSLDTPHYLVSETQQIGNSFGERITHAIKQVFDQGYEHVIAIGADCPNIHKQLLEKAVQNAKHGHCTIGPAKDGGLYLLSVSKDHFDQDAFIMMPWESSSLVGAYRSYLEREGLTINTLKTLADLDDIHSFIKVNFAHTDWVFKQLKTLLVDKANWFLNPLFSPFYLAKNPTLRGPPYSFS